jgi:hypothetical protein
MLEADPVLGAVVATYPADRARLLIPAALMIGVVAVLLNFTLAAVPDWGPPLTVGLSALVSLIVGWWVLHFWNREVILYENGFSYREGGRDVLFHFAEIHSFRQHAEQMAYFGGRLRRVSYRFTMIGLHGERIVLGNLYRRVGELGLRLEQGINRQLEPAIRDRLAKGERVPFSDTLRLSNDGLHERGHDLAWPDYGGYQLSGGQLTLRAADGSAWFSLPLSEVDNLLILVKLLRERKT